MKKLIMAVIASTAFASPALASTSVEIPLSGTLAKSCTISAFLNGPFNALDMSSTAVQGAESLTGLCNYGGSATVTLSSLNAGKLKSGANEVAYKMIVSGSGSAWSAGQSLATPQTIPGFPAVANAAQTRGLSVQLDAVATIAGTYTDTVTASITPN